MSTELATTLNAQMQFSQMLADSTMLPAQYRRQPANVLWAVRYGQSLGIDPMTAIVSVHLIDGKPTASASLIGALVRRAGHRLRSGGNDSAAWAEIVRRDDPEFTFRVEWTLDRARQAGVAGKDNWRKFPGAMLQARAITEVARQACQEVLLGLLYTPEELGAEVDAEGAVVEAPAVRPVPPAVRESEPIPPPRDPPRERLDWITEARMARTRAVVQSIYRDARAGGADQNTLDCLAEIGRGKPQEAASAPQTPAPEVLAPPPAPEAPASSQTPPQADPHATLRAEVAALLKIKNGSDLIAKPEHVATAGPDALEHVAAVLRERCTKRQSQALADLCEQAGEDPNVLRKTWGVRSRAYLTAERCSELIGEYERRLDAPEPSAPAGDDAPFDDEGNQ